MLGGFLVEMARKVKERNVVGGTEVELRGAWMIALIMSWWVLGERWMMMAMIVMPRPIHQLREPVITGDIPRLDVHLYENYIPISWPISPPQAQALVPLVFRILPYPSIPPSPMLSPVPDEHSVLTQRLHQVLQALSYHSDRDDLSVNWIKNRAVVEE